MTSIINKNKQRSMNYIKDTSGEDIHTSHPKDFSQYLLPRISNRKKEDTKNAELRLHHKQLSQSSILEHKLNFLFKDFVPPQHRNIRIKTDASSPQIKISSSHNLSSTDLQQQSNQFSQRNSINVEKNKDTHSSYSHYLDDSISNYQKNQMTPETNKEIHLKVPELHYSSEQPASSSSILKKITKNSDRNSFQVMHNNSNDNINPNSIQNNQTPKRNNVIPRSSILNTSSPQLQNLPMIIPKNKPLAKESVQVHEQNQKRVTIVEDNSDNRNEESGNITSNRDYNSLKNNSPRINLHLLKDPHIISNSSPQCYIDIRSNPRSQSMLGSIKLDYFKLNPSPEQRFLNKYKQKNLENNQNNLQGLHFQHKNPYLSALSGAVTERNIVPEQLLNAQQKQKKLVSLHQQRHSMMPRTSNQYQSQPTNPQNEQQPPQNILNDKSLGVETKLSLLAQLGGADTVDKIIKSFKEQYENLTSAKLQLDYAILRDLILMVFDREQPDRQKISNRVRMHFKAIKLGKLHYLMILGLFKSAMQSSGIPENLSTRCMNKLQHPEKYMVSVSLLEEVGGEEQIVYIVNSLSQKIQQSDEILNQILKSHQINLDQAEIHTAIVDFIKLLLIDPNILSTHKILEYVQPLDLSYIDFFRIKFLVERELRELKWSEVNISLTFARFEQFRFYFLKPPPFYLKLLSLPSFQQQVTLDVFHCLKRCNFIYQLQINNKITFEAIQSICNELVPFLLLARTTKEYFFVLKPFKSQKPLMSQEFFNLFQEYLISSLKEQDFEETFLIEIIRKIEFLTYIENIQIPLSKQLPANAFEEMTTAIVDSIEEQIPVMGKHKLNQIVSAILSDCYGRLANDIMPIKYTIWDLMAAKVWFSLDSTLVFLFNSGLQRYFDSHTKEIDPTVQKAAIASLKNLFTQIESLL